MAEERIDPGELRLDPLTLHPPELRVLVPDPDWWAAWERWAQVSDRRDANGQ